MASFKGRAWYGEDELGDLPGAAAVGAEAHGGEEDPPPHS